MFYVFMSMPSEGWDEDWLAEDEVVMPDAIREFDVNDRYASKPRQCTFDIKVQYSNDVEHRLMGVNICSISRIDAMSDKLVVVY